MYALKIIEPKKMPLPPAMPKHIPLQRPEIHIPHYIPIPNHPNIQEIYRQEPISEPVCALYGVKR